MGSACSRGGHPSELENEDKDMYTLRLKFNALAETRSDDGYIIKEDFLNFFNLPGLLGERLFMLFNTSGDGKVYWNEFKTGIEQFKYGDNETIDKFIFHFFTLANKDSIAFTEFQTIMQHMPPSVLFVVLKSSENRCDDAIKWTQQYGNQMNELPTEAIEEGISIIIDAFFKQGSEESNKHISFHDFSVFLREQPHLKEFFQTLFNVTNICGNCGAYPLSHVSSFLNTTHSRASGDTYTKMPFDTVDPEVYRTRNNRHELTLCRAMARSGHPEKWQGYARAYWSIWCKHCGKEVRFCCMCQGELRPANEDMHDNIKRLQCTECHRMVAMRYCSACGHLFEDTVVDARVEIPGVTVEIKGYSGELWFTNHFGMINKKYARIHSNFMYIYTSQFAETPSEVLFLERAAVKSFKEDSGKLSKYYGLCIQFPSCYDKEYYCVTEEERDGWIKAIEDVSGVRQFDDFYDIREKIGEGRFAEVYRCINKKTLQEYAVKRIGKKNLTDKELELMHTEVAILSLVQHKNIVTLIETFEGNEYMYIVMELLKGGELYANICGRNILTEEEAFKIIYPLADCLCYLHRMGIIHRDLKPENILCNRNLFDVKVGTTLPPHPNTDSLAYYPCGTLNYIAPEVITREGYTTKADMWSLGVIFYLLLRGRLPFDGNTKEETIGEVLHGVPDYDNKAFLRLSPNCREVIRELLQKDPSIRLSADDVLHHPWIEEMKQKVEAEMDNDGWVKEEDSSVVMV